MRNLRLLILWFSAAALVLTIFSYGLVSRYWYAKSEGGHGYSLKTWEGTSLDESPGYEKGYTYRHSDYRFEQNPEIRTIAIIVILAGTSFLTLRILSHPKELGF